MIHIHSKRKQSLLTAIDARNMFSYDHVSGDLFRSSGRYKGKVAGAVTTKGYRQARANGALFAVHRLCWLVHYGEWPQGDVDHINGNKLDNAISNLRSVTVADNNKNRTNATKPKGYSYDKQKCRWRVYQKTGGKYRHLGYFNSEAEAAGAAINGLRRGA